METANERKVEANGPNAQVMLNVLPPQVEAKESKPEGSPLAAMVSRLGAEQEELDPGLAKEGEEDGRRWAEAEASLVELRALWRFIRYQGHGPDGLGDAVYVAEAVFGDEDEVPEGFWKAEDPAYVRGFVSGAVGAWQAANQKSEKLARGTGIIYLGVERGPFSGRFDEED
jgi:hypothetical protein